MLFPAVSFPEIIVASWFGKRNITAVHMKPRTMKVASATLNMRLTWRGRPRVSASAIMRESAMGSPAVEIVRRRL